MVHVARRQAGVRKGLLEGLAAPVQKVAGEVLELGPAQLVVHMEWPRVGGGDEGQVHIGALGLRQLDLGPLRALLEPLHGHVVLAQVYPVVVAERVHQPADHPVVPVVAAQGGVAAGGLDLEHPVANLQDGYVEGAPAQVENQNGLVGVALVEAVGQGGRGGFVDDPQHLEAGDGAGLFGGGALGVVEVGRDGDNRLGDVSAQIGLGVPLELLQNPG